jgi:ribosomal 30S subunit maturation factor RimM
MNFNIKVNGKNGEIINIDDSTANVLFEVRLDDNSVKLLQVADEFIISLDVDERFVEMEVPPELLEL